MIIRPLLLLLAVLAGVTIAATAHAEDPQISALRAKERKAFTDAEIARGFFRIVFGAELHTAGRVDRVRKYVVPVRVFIDNRADADRATALAGIIDDIRSRIANLDIALTTERSAANVVVRLVRDRDLRKTIIEVFGKARGRRITRALDPQCLSGFVKDADYRITRSEVILVVDAGELVFRDCAYEELLQALGPINDDSTVPWTMFNDNVQKGFFGVYDQYLLNILYHPRVRPGMTRAEMRALLPQIMPDVRAFVAKTNNLPR